jgi:hypothetical protein
MQVKNSHVGYASKVIDRLAVLTPIGLWWKSVKKVSVPRLLSIPLSLSSVVLITLV